MRTLFTFLALALLTVGCATFTVKPGSSAEVVYAEFASEQALSTFDAFLRWERQNEAVLLKADPSIHKVANDIRDHGMTWIAELNTAIRTYKANRTGTNLTALQQAQALLQLAITEIQAATAKGAR